MAAGVFAGHGERIEAVAVFGIEFRGESVLFVAEDQELAFLCLQVEETPFCFGGEEDQPWRFHAFQEALPVLPPMPVKIGPVVQSGASQVCIVNGESKRFNEMQDSAGADAEASDGAGVLRDFRSVEYNMERLLDHDQERMRC